MISGKGAAAARGWGGPVPARGGLAARPFPASFNPAERLLRQSARPAMSLGPFRA